MNNRRILFAGCVTQGRCFTWQKGLSGNENELVRKQMFLDGNKRTSMLAGNHVMISNGCGIISVPIELQPTFTELLIRFYESNDMTEIKQFLYENCIDGIEFTPLPEQNTEQG